MGDSMDRRWTRFKDGVEIASGFHDASWEQVRAFRDELLNSSDWRAVKDRVLPNEWKEYRQALRDLPQDYEEANDAVDNWPEAPE
jgi:DNA-binding ferritin-like protein (Dps family)